MEFIKPGTNFDFVGKRYIAAAFSGLMVMGALALFFVVGPNWGIDFTGGTEIHLRFNDSIEIGEVREALAAPSTETGSGHVLGLVCLAAVAAARAGAASFVLWIGQVRLA